MKGLTIIIPALNEENTIRQNFPKWVPQLRQKPVQLIMVDGGSSDQTVLCAETFGFELIESSRTGRSIQMNEGARKAKYDRLFFLHADAQPPLNLWAQLQNFEASGLDFGLFPYEFEPSNIWLTINAKQTFKKGPFTGGGDQGLWIKKQVFHEVGCFDENLPIMEDFDLFWRLKEKYRYDLASTPLKVSSRKYQSNSYLKVQLVNLYVFLAFRFGQDPKLLEKRYKKWL